MPSYLTGVPAAPAWRSALSRCAPALLLFVALCALLLREITDTDIWFHLVVGRELAASQAIPAREFYLFPVLGEPALFSALGFGLLHYAAYQAAGYAGMVIVNALIGAAAMTLLVCAARPEKESPWDWPVLLCVLALVYACLNFRLVYRPESTLYLALAIEILLLERWLSDGRIARLAWLPLLSWGITQFHTTAVLLMLVYGAYVFQWAVEVWRQRPAPRSAALWLAAIGAAMLLLPLINPNGVEQFLVLVQLVRGLGSDASRVIEYLPVWQTPYLKLFAALALIVAWAYWRAPRRRLVDALLLAGFGYLALKHVRNLGLFAWVALLPVSRTLLHHLARDTTALSVRWRRALAVGLALFGIAGLLAVTRYGGWGVGVRAERFPVKAAELIRHVAPGGNVMNLFALGGYLAWELGPNYRVAMDGHFVRPSYANIYHDQVMQGKADWAELLDRHSVRIVVTSTTLPYSGRMVGLVERLADSPRWRLLSVEPGGLLFVADGLGADLPALDKREIWWQVQREAGAVVASAPERQPARDSLALAARRLASP